MRRRTVLATCSLLVVTACGDGDSPSSAEPSTTATERATDPPPSAKVGATPVELPFDGGLDWRIAVAPDGATALIAQSDGFFPQTRDSTIFEVTRQPDDTWGDPAEVPFVDDATSDIDPFFSADGSRVWFSSIRAVDGVPRDDVEVWYVDREDGGSWGEPVHAAEVGSAGDDLFPSIGADGSLYVGSDRGGDGFDIWRVPPGPEDGTWSEPVALPAPVTTAEWEFNPVLTPDGSTLVFTAQGRDGGQGAGDLFFSRLTGETWSTPVPLDSVNTRGDEYHPAFSPDGDILYFVRDRDLYELPVGATELGN